MIMHPARRGFTLVELLVVMAVLVIITAVAVPAYNRSQEKMRQTQCISNLNSIGQALRMYRLDWKGYPPRNNPAYYKDNPEFDYNALLTLTDAIALGNPAYITGRKTFLCPNDEYGKNIRDPLADIYSSYNYDPSGVLTANKDADANIIMATCSRHAKASLILRVSGEVDLEWQQE